MYIMESKAHLLQTIFNVRASEEFFGATLSELQKLETVNKFFTFSVHDSVALCPQSSLCFAPVHFDHPNHNI